MKRPESRTRHAYRQARTKGTAASGDRSASAFPQTIARPINLRRFLVTSVVATASLPVALPAALVDLDWRFLTLDEARLLAVLCDVIIPPDQDPGAAAAGVVQFMDRKLVGYHRGSQTLYRAGLAALSACSQRLFQKPLTQLAPEDRVALVRRWEKGDLPAEPWKGAKPGEFFDRFIDHVMQGFFGGPRHGGNRQAVSWRMLGLSQPPVRSRRPESPRRTQP